MKNDKVGTTVRPGLDDSANATLRSLIDGKDAKVAAPRCRSAIILIVVIFLIGQVLMGVLRRNEKLKRCNRMNFEVVRGTGLDPVRFVKEAEPFHADGNIRGLEAFGWLQVISGRLESCSRMFDCCVERAAVRTIGVRYFRCTLLRRMNAARRSSLR